MVPRSREGSETCRRRRHKEGGWGREEVRRGERKRGGGREDAEELEEPALQGERSHRHRVRPEADTVYKGGGASELGEGGWKGELGRRTGSNKISLNEVMLADNKKKE
eukprot:216745-Hanusia_phi.AAC.2